MVVALAVVPVAAGGTEPNIPSDGGGCYFKDVDCGTGSGATGTLTESPGLYGYSPDAAAGRCRTRWARATRSNLLGLTVFTYNEQARWCWNGLKVTYMHRDRWPADTHAGWAFDGNIGGNCTNEFCTGMTGASTETVWTQGKFHVCLGALGINYCSYKYPRVSITVNANGTSSASWGGA